MIQDYQQLAGMLTGADSYLLKPVRLAELVKAIEQAMQTSDEERHRRAAKYADEWRDDEGNGEDS